MDIFQVLSTIIPIGVASGINLYATVLVVGLCVRYNLVTNVPAAFQPFASDVVILVAAILYVMQFLADKIQFIDNLSDFIHTFIRPVGAAIIAFSVVVSLDPQLAIVAAMISGSAALVSHGSKAGSRVALNVASPVENVSNIGLSVAEDVGVGILSFLTLQYPYLAASIALVFLVVLVMVVPPLLRWSWFNINTLAARFTSLFKPVVQSEELPSGHRALLTQQPSLSVRCRAQHIRGANGKQGYLSLTNSHLCFTYDGWFCCRKWCMDYRNIANPIVRRKLLMDVLELHSQESSDVKRVARFAFTKDRTTLFEMVVNKVQGKVV